MSTGTARKVAERFLEEYVPAHCKPGTRTVYRSALVNHVVPRLGARRVADIERADIVALHRTLRATPCQANRTAQILSRLFTLSEVWGLRPDGSYPCRHVRRFREEKRERFLSNAENGRLGAALKEGEEQGLEPPEVIAAGFGLQCTVSFAAFVMTTCNRRYRSAVPNGRIVPEVPTDRPPWKFNRHTLRTPPSRSSRSPRESTTPRLPNIRDVCGYGCSFRPKM